MDGRLDTRSLPADDAALAHVEEDAPVRDGQRRLRLVGELDMGSVRLLEPALLELAEAGTSITLDLSGLKYCDSQGIRLFFEIAKVAGEHGGALTLSSPQGIVRRVFEIVDIAAHVHVAAEPARLRIARDATSRAGRSH